MYTAETEIDINGEPINITIDFMFYPGDKGVHTYSNGDPGYPPTGDEIDVLSVQDENGTTVPDNAFTSEQVETIIQVCRDYMEKLGDD